MAIKKERFTQWRKEKAEKEHIYFNCAVSINHYLSSIKSLDQIKADFSGTDAQAYLKLNENSARPFGLLLYMKFQIDEALEQITAADLIQRPLLLDLSELFSTIYDSPAGNIKDSVNKLSSKCEQFLGIDGSSVEDKELTKKLLLDFYFFFHIVSLSIIGLLWYERTTANFVINTHDLNIRLQHMARTAELRRGELEHWTYRASTTVDLRSIKATAQEYFNQRYMAIVKTHGSEEQIVSSMSEVITLITALLNKKAEKEKITTTIDDIKKLIMALKPDKDRVLSRRSFLDLLKMNSELFAILKAQLNDSQNALLDKKIVALEQSLGEDSWLSTAAKTTCSRVTPKVLQDALSSENKLLQDCRQQILEFANDRLMTLHLQEVNLDKEIDEIGSRLSKNSPELNQLVTYESTVNLESLRKANLSARKALLEYRQVAKSMSDQILNLKVIRKANAMLSEFIHHYDGFWVLLSNLLAHIFSFFKSDTAILIDNARETNRQLLLWELENTVILNKELNALEDNPALDNEMRVNIKDKVNRDLLATPEIKGLLPPDTGKVRCLTSNLRGFFSRPPGTNVFEREKKEPEEIEEFTLPTPC